MLQTKESIKLVRIIKAPREDVYQAWISPTLMPRWLTPGNFIVEDASTDARVGGSYSIKARDLSGNVHSVSGEYIELLANTHIVKTYVYDHPHQMPVAAPTLLTVEFREIEPGITELSFEFSRLPDMQATDVVAKTWADGLATLKSYFAAKSDKPQ